MNGNTEFIAMCKKIGIEWLIGPRVQVCTERYHSKPVDLELADAFVKAVNNCVIWTHRFSYLADGTLEWACTTESIDEVMRKEFVAHPREGAWTYKLLRRIQARAPEAFKRAYKVDSYPPIDVNWSKQEEVVIQEDIPKVDPMPLAGDGEYSTDLIAQELLRAIKLSQGTTKASEDPYVRVLLGKLINVYFSTDEGHRVPRGDSYVQLLIDKAKGDIHRSQHRNELEVEMAKHEFRQSYALVDDQWRFIPPNDVILEKLNMQIPKLQEEHSTIDRFFG